MLISPTMASMIEANTIQPVHAVFWGGAAARSNLASVLVIGPSPSGQQPALLGRELLFREDAVVPQLRELAELSDGVDRWGRRRRRGRRRVVLRLRLRVLRRP